MAQPQPGELDHRCSQPRIAGFGHALFAIDRSALPGRRRQAGVGSDLASIVEVSEQPFRPEDGGELRPDALMSSNIAGRSRRCRSALARSEQRVPLGLHRLDLFEQQFEPIEFAADLRLQMLRQGTAIARPQLLEPLAADRGAAARSRICPGRTAVL